MRLNDKATNGDGEVEADLEEMEYFAEGYSSWEDVEESEGGVLYDGSTLKKIQKCPRKFELEVVEGLVTNSEAPPDYMVCGSVIHEALDYFYAHKNGDNEQIEDEAIELARHRWRESGIESVPPKERNKDHLDEEHIVDVLKYYFDQWERNRVDVFHPIRGFEPDDLNMDNVIAARFRLTDEGHVIFGESALVMEFDVDGEKLILAGRPDLPVRKQDGRIYIMDHKTSQGYLSDWWASKFETSNKLRGYMAMVKDLLELDRLHGGVINGIYCGKRAASSGFGGTRSKRFEFDFNEDHVEEALRNQLTWAKTIEFYKEQGYWPQACGFGGCAHPDICCEEPDKRGMVKAKNYESESRTKFQDI